MDQAPTGRVRYSQMHPRDFPVRLFGVPFVGIFGVGTLVLGASTLGGDTDGPGSLFMSFWIAAVGWNGYWFIWRFALDLRFDGQTLYWDTLLLKRETPIYELTEVRPFRLGGADAIHRNDGPSILVMSGAGLDRFFEAVALVRPDLPIELRRKSKRASSALRPDGCSEW